MGKRYPEPERGPLGYVETLNGGAQSNRSGPTQRGANDAVTRRAKDGRKPVRCPANAGSRLKLDVALGRPRLKGQPSSRTGENSPYGMIGGIEETSASFEARPAPRSYPAKNVLHLLTSGFGSAPRRRESSVEEESTRRVVD